MRLFFILLSAAGSLYLLLIVGVYVFQKHLIYFPTGEIRRTPASLGLEYTDLRIDTEDGETITGWMVPHGSARATVLYFHGNGGNISGRVDIIQLLHTLELSVCAIDYRGYGRSTGSPSEQGTYLDAMAAWKYLMHEQNIPREKIVILGRSLGGAVAAWLGSQVQPGGVILGSSFTSIPDISREKYPFLPASKLTNIQYRTIERVREVNAPILITHSRDDTLIPFSHGRALYRAARAPKSFLEMRGSHESNILETRREYMRKIDEFIGEYLE